MQFEIKQYIDNENRLYLAVALTKINKTGVMDDTITEEKRSSTRLLPVFIYSVPQLIKKINTSDENFFKYMPDELLTDEQKKAKQNAIAKENAKYHRFSMEEDPANFILRLNTLNKQMPTYDLAGSSKDSIPDSTEKSNPSDENSSKKSSESGKRFAM